MGYWSYYLAWIVAWYLIGHPALLVGVLVFFALRRFIPDPWVWLRTAGRIRSLRTQVEANPANATARRDLARIYLERSRPRAALTLLEEARHRQPPTAELLYLTGVAKLRTRDAQGALEALGEAVEVDAGVAFGEPYLVAGRAHRALGNLEAASEAFQHFVEENGSRIDGFVELVRARRRLGDGDGARAALEGLFDAWRHLPGYLRRRQWTWWLRGCALRLAV